MSEVALPALRVPGPTALERLWYGAGLPAWLAPLRVFLVVASWIFARVVALRSSFYRVGLLRSARVPAKAKVVSVGNLNVGGSGKTPVVIHLTEQALRMGRRVAVLSRGYGGNGREGVVSDGSRLLLGARDAGDEPALIARRVPEAVVLVGPERTKLAERAAREFGCDLLLLDDGFQHRALARDEDVLVLGGASPLGNGAMLPLGPLREPIAAASRATVTWLSNVPDGSTLPASIPTRRVRSRTRTLDVTDWMLRESFGPKDITGRATYLVCGLARPSGFVRTVTEELGAHVVGHRFVGDHHIYAASELEHMQAEAARLGAEYIVTTEKDAVRMEKAKEVRVPVRAVRIALEILEGRDVIYEVLR